MSLVEREVELYECPSCNRRKLDGEATCCGRPMETIETTVAFKPPELEQMVKQVFGIASTELAICEVLMAEGEATISELSKQIPHDRSTISRHLNHLVSLDMVTKRSKNLNGGGRAHVYSFVSPDEIRQNLHLGIYMWSKEARELADELTQAKIEAMVEQSGEATSGSNAETTTQKPRAAGDNKSESDNGEQGNSVIDRLFDYDLLH